MSDSFLALVHSFGGWQHACQDIKQGVGDLREGKHEWDLLWKKSLGGNDQWLIGGNNWKLIVQSKLLKKDWSCGVKASNTWYCFVLILKTFI